MNIKTKRVGDGRGLSTHVLDKNIALLPRSFYQQYGCMHVSMQYKKNPPAGLHPGRRRPSGSGST